MLSIDTNVNSPEQSSQGRGWIVSLLMHILVIIAFCLPMMMLKTPPPEEEEGLLVNLGLLDQGQGEETPKGPLVPETVTRISSDLLFPPPTWLSFTIKRKFKFLPTEGNCSH